MELKRRELQSNTTEDTNVRQAELASYFTHCNLQLGHLTLCLRSAMVATYKLKNYQIAGSFARRLLELNPKPDIATQAKKVAKNAEQVPKNEVPMKYDERNPFVICGISFTPIYKGTACIQCPYCATSYLPEHKGALCTTCQLSQIGKEVSGLQISLSQQRSKD